MRWNEVSSKAIRRTLVVILCFWCPNSMAQGQSDALTGEFFEELDVETENDKTSDEGDETDPVFSGFIKQEAMYALHDQDLAFPFSRKDSELTQLRSTVNLSAEGRLFSAGNYRISGNAFYDAAYRWRKESVSDEEYDEMGSEAELRDAYVNLKVADNLWLKTGRQIIAWGQSDFAQILDLANPRDDREYGLVDLEDARLPVFATRLSFVGVRWGTDIVVAHEFRPNRWGPEASDFDPFIAFRNFVTIDGEHQPELGLESADFMWRGLATFPSGDISVIYGKVHDHNPVFQAVEGAPGTVVLGYPEIEAFGVGANLVTGSWLWKAELARTTGKMFPRDDLPSRISTGTNPLYMKKPLDQLMLGMEYSGSADLQLAAEWLGSRIDSYDPTLLTEEFQSTLYARATVEFWRDTANVEAVYARWLEEDSSSTRIAFNYDLTDAVKLSAGAIDYSGATEGSTLYPYRKNDRIFASVRYSF